MRRLHVTAMSLLATVALAACNSASDVLQTTAQQSPQPAPAGTASTMPQPTATAPAATAAITPPAAPSAQAAAVIGKMRLQIAPIVGPTVEAAAPLTERLNMRARERGITLAGSTDSNATHVLKGYFSLLSEGKNITVIYVWDIYDPSGNRLHRINGQQRVEPAGTGEGWAAVPAQTMQAVADNTMNQLVAWLGGSAG
ncbi:MAG: hypothetical protein J0I98_12340 [Mesorhizobium sp.]|nr:hypothetical protein [Mesorhizobium sp.]MBN9243571.1 hypothetical protein [Mesorhizobium sp.]